MSRIYNNTSLQNKSVHNEKFDGVWSPVYDRYGRKCRFSDEESQVGVAVNVRTFVIKVSYLGFKVSAVVLVRHNTLPVVTFYCS